MQFQKRFLFSGEDTASKWYVPISYSLSLDPDKFERSSPIIWLTPNNDESFTLPNDCDWIILNNQQSGKENSCKIRFLFNISHHFIYMFSIL